MEICFWGTRGSIPTPLSAAAIKDKLRQALAMAHGLDLSDPDVRERYIERLPFTIQGTTGGNTACVEVRSGEQMLILDAGSGIRPLGLDMMQRGFGSGNHQIDIMMTHTHWDHIQGFPFFVPAFMPTNRITFYSPFPDLGERLERQQRSMYFPRPLDVMGAGISFVTVPEQQWTEIGGLRIYPLKLSHPGTSYAYRIEDGRSCMVYATDSEYKQVDPASTEAYVELFRNADVLIFDAQYSLSEALDRRDWGHSSALVGAEFARRAGVRRLVLFHHDPTSSDEKIWAARDQALAYLDHHAATTVKSEVLVGYDGLHIIT